MASAVAMPSSVSAPKPFASLTWKRRVRTATDQNRPTVASASRSGVVLAVAPLVGARNTGAGALSVEPSEAAPVDPAAAAEGDTGEPLEPLQPIVVMTRPMAPRT